MKKISVIFILFFLTFIVNAQKKEDFLQDEDSLKVLANLILSGKDDFVKYNANARFVLLMENSLLKENSIDYPYDSLKSIKILCAPDKKVRLVNWVIVKKDGTFEYFAFLQLYNKQKKGYDIISLQDKSDEIQFPDIQICDHNKWYGALYYKIIQNKYAGKKYYTLLGWDGNDLISNKKIIEVLTVGAKNKPVFGAQIFSGIGKKNSKRIFFEYSESTTLALRYENQFMSKGKNRKNMIVFDHLSPLDKSMEGNMQYYVPDTNIQDAFYFKNGKWHYIKDIDARNPKEKKHKIRNRTEHNHQLDNSH
ncbi:MAG: hypothetical protein HXX09_03855 [Bacteroidetes bacterium]|nr:hypothetical protein [Bacteroidota bacterium]